MRFQKLIAMYAKYLLIVVLSLSLFACKEKQKSNSVKEENTEEVATYFSVTDFFIDQWSNRRGNPYTLLRIVTLNGKSDSSFVQLDSTLWFSLRAKFDAADIKNRKFLGQYNFDMFEDQTNIVNVFVKDEKKSFIFNAKTKIFAISFE